MDYILIVTGLLLLFAGGESLVRGSVAISQRLGISAILIGVVVVGFGTSAPELLVSIKASLAGQPDIALGNVVGSNIANTLLILGLAATITPVLCKDKAIHRDALATVAATVVLLGLSHLQMISKLAAGLMLTTLIVYLLYAYKAERKEKQATSSGNLIETAHEHEFKEFESKLSIRAALLLSLIGIIMLVLGADFLVKGATSVARKFNVSEAVIGLSLVAIGTSLPELATAFAAAIKKNSDVIIGNVLGSNLFNILSILSITALIKPIPITGRIATFDIPLAFSISLLSTLAIFYFQKIGRKLGWLSLIFYFFYITWIYKFKII